jgi:hypothetical protein
VLDTEQGSAAKYRNEFPRKFQVIDNDCWKGNYNIEDLTAALKELVKDYDGIVVDSLSHFWFAAGGALEQVEVIGKKLQARTGKYDSFAAWKEVTKQYQTMITEILNLPCHFIGCLRSKTDYEDKEVNGKMKKVKVGLAPQMRQDFEYEFDVQGMMDIEHNMLIEKTRCPALDGQLYPKPGANVAKPINEWLSDYDYSVAAQPVAEEYVGPTTSPMIEAVPALFDTLLTAFQAAQTNEQIKAAGDAAGIAKKDGAITGDQYKALVAEYKIAKNRVTP